MVKKFFLAMVAFGVLCILVVLIGCQESNETPRLSEKINKKDNNLAVSITSIDIPEKKDEFLIIYATLENVSQKEIKSVIQGRARFIVEVDNKFYAEKDFGGKSSFMPHGKKFGPIAIDTKGFRQIEKVELYPFVDPKADELKLEDGEHNVRILYKINGNLVPSEYLTVNVSSQ